MRILPSCAFTSTKQACTDRSSDQAVFARSLDDARACDDPYPHWLLAQTLPPELAWALSALPLASPPPASEFPERINPQTSVRHFFTRRELEAFPACRQVAETFQSQAIIASIARATATDLTDCQLRISLAREVDGYECSPHTRHGEARFSLMIALDTDGQRDLGPDLYGGCGDWVAQAPWTMGRALAFAPSERSWHGFEPRMIRGVRTSLIVDYLPAAKAQRVPMIPVDPGAPR
jgi:hypothetical protein